MPDNNDRTMLSVPSGTTNTKRRRLNESSTTGSNGGNGSENYWDDQFIAQHHAGLMPGEGSALGSGDTPQWEPSAYPELATYQQQPYYYQANDASGYAPSWTDVPNTTAQPSLSATPETMPFFPSSASAAPGPSGEGHAVVPSGYQYSDVDTTMLDAQYAYGKSMLLPQSDRDVGANASMFDLDHASMHLKNQSLPILDNLATQLIHTIAKASFPQIQELMKGDDSEDGQAYKTLKSLFDQTRKVYSRQTAFIDAIAIQMFQPNQQEIIRKANIATFISSILGAHDVSFFYLNEYFMETFVPLGHRLLKWQGAIYLELKTQTYISAVFNSDSSPEEMLDELFPPDLDAQILTRHPDAPSLSPSEQDFIDRSRARKSYLLAEPRSEENRKELSKKYQWIDFAREFASCINKNVEGIMNVPVRAQAAIAGASTGKNTSESTAALMMGSSGAGNKATAGSQGTGGHGKSASSSSQAQSNSDGSRKPAQSAATVRQPWTKPEEDALLAGLERVNGPHWSQILALYGRGGSVSEVLKDRNQVQLKDKARNLKLWYLKMGKEVPVSLRGVTGELRKRGGARARAAMGLVEEEDGAGDGADDGGGEPDRNDKGKKKGRKK